MRHRLWRYRLAGWGLALTTILAIAGAVSRAQIVQQVLLQETFRGPDASASVLTLDVNTAEFPCLTADAAASTGDSTIANCDLASPDPVGSGALRFTSTAEQHASGIVAQTSLPTAQGLDISFTQYQYGGYGIGGPGQPGGADGISFFLAVAPPSPTVLGPQGGALGYASSGSSPGLPGAWLGIGLDAFGNFSNPAFGSPSCPAKSWAGFSPDAITVRGPGNGLDGYCLLASSANEIADANLEWPGLSTVVYAAGLPSSLRGPDRASSARDIRIQITPDDGQFRVFIDDGAGPELATFGQLPTSYYDPQTGSLVSGLPPRVTFGFAASTGSATDIHEISDLVATTTSGAVPVVELTKTASAGASVSPGQAFSYTLTPRIAGTTAETLPLTLRVSDDLPSGLTLSGTPTGTSWSCTASSSSSFSCAYTAAGSIPAGTNLPSIMVPVIVDSGAANGTTIVNTATVLSADAATPAFATATVTVSTTPPLAITTATLPGGTVGTAYNATLAATGGTGARTWSLASGALPAGVTLSTTGVISGSPTASSTASFTVRVTDTAAATTTKALSIVVTPGVAPLVITTTSLPRGATGLSYTAQLQASGGTGPYRWSRDSGTLPPGLTMTTSGQITGTPTTTGVFTLFVRVTDANGATSARGFNLQVVPQPVQIATTQLPPGEVSLPFTAALAATGGVPPYTWSLAAGALPAGLLLTPTGVISGTPTLAGTTVFWVRATDSSGRTAGQRLTITIVPRVTITTTSLPNGRVGTAYSRTLLRSGGLAPFTWSLASGSLPAGLTLSSAGVISGAPTTAGTANFTVRVRDSLNVAATRALSIVVASRPEKAYIGVRGNRGFDNAVQVVDVATGALVKRIAVPQAEGTVASHDGRRVYFWGAAGIPNAIGLIDPSTDTLLRTRNISVSSTGYTFIQDVKVSPDNSLVYVTASANTTGGGFVGSIFVLNAGTLAQVRQYAAPQTAYKIALSPDGATAYISSIESPGGVYKLHSMSTSTGSIIASRTVPLYAWSMLTTPSGDRLVVSSAYFTGTRYQTAVLQYSVPDLTEVSRTDVPQAFWIGAVDNSFAYAVHTGSVSAVDLLTGLVRSAPVVFPPATSSLGGLAFDASRQNGYTLALGAGQYHLVRFNLSSLAQSTTAAPALPPGASINMREFAVVAVGP